MMFSDFLTNDINVNLNIIWCTHNYDASSKIVFDV